MCSLQNWQSHPSHRENENAVGPRSSKLYFHHSGLLGILKTILTPLGGHFFWTLVPRAIYDLGNLALRFLGLFRIAGLPVLDTPRPY